MRAIGCFSTRKYISDLQRIRDIKHCIENNKSSVLMYREAVYTPDGSCVPLPSTLAKSVKMLDVPLCILKTTEFISIIPLTPFRGLARFLSAQSYQTSSLPRKSRYSTSSRSSKF